MRLHVCLHVHDELWTLSSLLVFHSYLSVPLWCSVCLLLVLLQMLFVVCCLLLLTLWSMQRRNELQEQKVKRTSDSITTTTTTTTTSPLTTTMMKWNTNLNRTTTATVRWVRFPRDDHPDNVMRRHPAVQSPTKRSIPLKITLSTQKRTRTRVTMMTITTTELTRVDVNEHVQIELNENVDTVNPIPTSLSPHIPLHTPPLSTNNFVKKMKLNVVHTSSVLSN
jgi:preprotein translocase subunit YajC